MTEYTVKDIPKLIAHVKGKAGTLIRITGKLDPDFRANAAKALGELGAEAVEAVPALIMGLRDADVHLRIESARALGEIGPGAAAAVDALVEAFGDEVGIVTDEAASALGRIGEAAMPAILEALKHTDMIVRERAASALAKVGKYSKDAIPGLLKALDDESKIVRTEAVHAIGKIGVAIPEAEGALIKLLSGPHTQIRVHAAYALGRTGRSDEARLALIRALKDENEGVRANAAQGLGNIECDACDAIPALINATKDIESPVRKNALIALEKIGPEHGVLRAITEALVDDSVEVRITAVRSLGSFGRGAKSAVGDVINCLGDTDASMRMYCAHTLGRIGAEPEVVQALIGALLDPDPRVRSNACQALANIGPPAKDAVPYLKKHAERDKDDWVKKFAAQAIGKIEEGM